MGSSATFAAPGYYVAATSLPELATQPGRSRHTSVVLGIGTAAAVLLFAGAFVIVRRRRARTDVS